MWRFLPSWYHADSRGFFVMHPGAFFGALSQCESINAIDNDEREKEEGTSQFSLTFPCSGLAFFPPASFLHLSISNTLTDFHILGETASLFSVSKTLTLLKWTLALIWEGKFGGKYKAIREDLPNCRCIASAWVHLLFFLSVDNTWTGAAGCIPPPGHGHCSSDLYLPTNWFPLVSRCGAVPSSLKSARKPSPNLSWLHFLAPLFICPLPSQENSMQAPPILLPSIILVSCTRPNFLFWQL